MPRFKLTVEYDGSGFVGWQRQANGQSVQQVLEEAAEAYCQTPIAVQGAGRTDAGVHATAQVAHLDIPRNDDGNRVRDALNALVRPHAVAVLKAEQVPDAFHARFDANERRYRYLISTRRAPLALERNRAWWLPRKLNAEAMHEGAQVLVGKHDFSTFRATECQAKTPVKTLTRISAERDGDTIKVDVEAPSFLHHQVRNIVGTLCLVGEGKWSKEDVETALKACDRRAGGQTAPPEGLYLTYVGYPDAGSISGKHAQRDLPDNQSHDDI